MVVEAPKRRGRPKQIQIEVIKVPKQHGKPRKFVEAYISQFKEYSRPKKGNVRNYQNHIIPLTNIGILNELSHVPYFRGVFFEITY